MIGTLYLKNGQIEPVIWYHKFDDTRIQFATLDYFHKIRDYEVRLTRSRIIDYDMYDDLECKGTVKIKSINKRDVFFYEKLLVPTLSLKEYAYEIKYVERTDIYLVEIKE